MISPGSKLGHYEVLSFLGEGGMGRVYRAHDPRLRRDVAIKVLHAEKIADETRRRRFVQEARAASALNHPNIVTIYEIDSVDGIDFIAMEYISGKSLDRLIPQRGMRLGEVLKIAIPIADALARAHAKGIVHRDLKPANVMLSDEGIVKVLDFGLAKLLLHEEASDEEDTVTKATDSGPLTHPGAIPGTAAYMSPEQATAGDIDSRSDVFSFGVMLYEMVTGRRAFGGASRSETLEAVTTSQPRSPSEIVPSLPRDLEKVIQRCLRKEPDRRFQHMLDVKLELEQIKEDSSSGSLVSPVPRPRPRARWVLVGIVGALALIAVSLLIWSPQRTEIAPPLVVSLTSTPGLELEPTFSPDGNQVAFAWGGEKSDNWDIYLKMVGSTETRRLTTDSARDRFPSWSPDGKQIAFLRASTSRWEAGTIHLISPIGGSDRKLSDAPMDLGRLSWSPDGRWLAVTRDRGIHLVSVPGGESRPITSPSAPTSHTDPSFSPDGHFMAYASCRTAYACEIDVAELGADYVPKGAARRLTRKVLWPAGLAWARDGKSVIYGDALNNRLWRVKVAGNQPPERLEVAGSLAQFPSIASGQNRLAFTRVVGSNDIYRFEPGRPAEIVAPSSAPDYSPHFSPDGRRFVWESGRAGEGDEIWIALADGSNPLQLTHGPGLWQGSPHWSPDGRRVAFDSEGEDGYWHIWTIDADGGSLRRLTQDLTDENLPTWSHDGRFIYFTSNRLGVASVWRALASGGPAERVTENGGLLALESSDGKTLFFTRPPDTSLYALPLAGGAERKVIDCVGIWEFAVGPAGVYHIGCVGGRERPLYLLNPATGTERLLGKLEDAAGAITASPDGKTILYGKTGGQGSDLMMIENFR